MYAFKITFILMRYLRKCFNKLNEFIRFCILNEVSCYQTIKKYFILQNNNFYRLHDINVFDFYIMVRLIGRKSNISARNLIQRFSVTKIDKNINYKININENFANSIFTLITERHENDNFFYLLQTSNNIFTLFEGSMPQVLVFFFQINY